MEVCGHCCSDPINWAVAAFVFTSKKAYIWKAKQRVNSIQSKSSKSFHVALATQRSWQGKVIFRQIDDSFLLCYTQPDFQIRGWQEIRQRSVGALAIVVRFWNCFGLEELGTVRLMNGRRLRSGALRETESVFSNILPRATNATCRFWNKTLPRRNCLWHCWSKKLAKKSRKKEKICVQTRT